MSVMDKNKWIKPSQCDTGGCVEIFHGENGDLVYVRKGTYTSDEWRAFVAAVKLGEFDV
jgi:hypothetical protein